MSNPERVLGPCHTLSGAVFLLVLVFLFFFSVPPYVEVGFGVVGRVVVHFCPLASTYVPWPSTTNDIQILKNVHSRRQQGYTSSVLRCSTGGFESRNIGHCLILSVVLAELHHSRQRSRIPTTALNPILNSLRVSINFCACARHKRCLSNLLLTIPIFGPLGTLCNTLHPTGGMVAFAGDPSPTVLAASMSTVDLGANCLGLVAGGGCGSICGASPVSRSGSPRLATRTTRNLNGNVPNSSGVAVVVPPTIPILMFEPDTDAGPNRSPYDIGLDGNVIDLSSTLQLPRTPSPSSRTAWQPQEPISPPPRTPRKSFLAKLRSLSSKGSNDSSSVSSSPHISTPPMPTLSPSSPNSKNPHIDSNNSVPRASPTGLFNLHFPFPLTPISLSKPNSPNHSRSPSPKPPYRRVSALSKRESAPVFSASYAPDGRVLPTNQGSPIYSADSGQDVKTADKRRIQSLYGSAPVPRLPTSRKEPSEKATVNEERRSAESMLSLADCLEGKTGSGERQSNVKEKRESTARGGSNEARQETQNTQPFPSKEPFSSSELEGMSSEPSNKSCESASRSPHGHMRTRSMKEGTKRSTGEKGMTFPVGASVDPAISQLSVQGRNGLGEPEQPGEDQIFAPFVPLVLQHERLQQKLKKPVPLASFEGAREVEGVGIKYAVLL